MTKLLSQGYKVNRLSNTFKIYGRHTDLVGQYKKNVCQMFADSIGKNDFHFYGFANGQIDKTSKDVVHEADLTYSIWCT